MINLLCDITEYYSFNDLYFFEFRLINKKINYYIEKQIKRYINYNKIKNLDFENEYLINNYSNFELIKLLKLKLDIEFEFTNNTHFTNFIKENIFLKMVNSI